jgi:hypothetical protein
MTKIAGVFDSKMEAEQAIANLLETGFTRNDMSLILSDNVRHSVFASPEDDQDIKAAMGGVAGALIGGALGALLASLTLVGVVVVPGVGLLATGPIVAALSGAGAGAIVGGLRHCLI